jgi:hypothetical protein
MKTTFKIAILATVLVLMLIADMPFLPLQTVPEADAVLGVRRRTRRRTAVVVGSAAAAQTAAAQQQTAAAQQQATAAQQQAAAATPPPPPPASAGKPLPIGTVVSTLPTGSTATTIGNVEYYQYGGNYYRAVFQGNNLVYVTAQPK